MRSTVSRLCVAILLLVLFLLGPPAHAEPVDVELVLAVDCSGSVDSDEFQLQIGGYASAFRHPSVLRAIRSGVHGAIAVTYVQWSGPLLQNQAVGWTVIRDEETAERFAAALMAMRRTIFGGGTSLSGAIDYSRTLFDNNGFEGARRVIDISGDGFNNAGRQPEAARDDAMQAGVVINGLAILTDAGQLDRYFQDRVIGGPGAFVVPVATFENFAAAILSKLIREIAQAPVK